MKPTRHKYRLLVFGICAIWFVQPSNLWASTFDTEEFVCPIDGESFSCTVATSGYVSYRRLDLRPMGPIASPWPMPQCPKCRFVLYSDEIDEDELSSVKKYVLGQQYQADAQANTTYYLYASILSYLSASSMDIAFAYLEASWQVEDIPDLTRMAEYLRLSRDRIGQYLKDEAPSQIDEVNARLLQAEIRRRLGEFDDAVIGLSPIMARLQSNDTLRSIVNLQLELIAAKDSNPARIP